MSGEPAGPDPLAEHTLSSAVAWRGGFLTVHRETVRVPDGVIAPREFIRHPGAVMIVPLLDDGQVVLERQWRHPLRRAFVEFPAGKIDSGESLQACAERELREETGYVATEWIHLGGFHNAIGYSDEKIEVYLARGLTRSAQALDPGEVLEVHTLPWQEVLAEVRAGRITDVKTVIGVYWLADFLAGRWPTPG
jgi:ADP-ribose pyrophosphatase